jgi:hypothetical protein
MMNNVCAELVGVLQKKKTKQNKTNYMYFFVTERKMNGSVANVSGLFIEDALLQPFEVDVCLEYSGSYTFKQLCFLLII